MSTCIICPYKHSAYYILDIYRMTAGSLCKLFKCVYSMAWWHIYYRIYGISSGCTDNDSGCIAWKTKLENKIHLEEKKTLQN